MQKNAAQIKFSGDACPRRGYGARAERSDL